MPSKKLSKERNPPIVRRGLWYEGAFIVTLQEFVRSRLAVLNQTQTWLASEMQCSNASLSEYLKLVRIMPMEMADRMANAIGVNIVILLRLSGLDSASTSMNTVVPASGEITDNGTARAYDQTERLSGPRVLAPAEMLEGDAWVIRIDALRGRFSRNEVVWTDGPPTTPAAELLAREAVVQLADGRLLLRQVLPSATPGRVSLLSLAGELEQNAEVVGGAAIVWHSPMPPASWPGEHTPVRRARRRTPHTKA